MDATQVLDFNHESVKESPCRQELFILMKSGNWSTKHLRDCLSIYNGVVCEDVEPFDYWFDYSVVKITSL